MSSIKGTNVLAPVVPFDTSDSHASHEARYGRGGYRSVADIAERDAIPALRREAGMLVCVLTDGKVWRLGDNLTTWSEFAVSSDWATLPGKPSTFPPSSHTHTASSITDFASAVAAAAPPTTDASLLTSGTLSASRLSSAVALYAAINAYNSGPAAGFDIYPRGEAANLTMTLNNGVVYFSFFTPVVTVTVSSITMACGTTVAASGLTLARMGLYTFDGTTTTLVARTASDTTLFTQTNTAYARNFSEVGGYPASYELNAGTRYGVAILFTGTTMPVCAARTSSPAWHAQAPRTTANLGSQTDLPASASVASFGIQQGMPFARLS